MTRLTLDEARARLGELLDEAARGGDVLITGDGATYRLALVQVERAGAQRRMPDVHAGLIEVAEDFDDELPDDFWLGEERPA